MELMISVLIVGILATILSINLAGSRDKALDREAATYLQMLRRASQEFYENFSTYPTAMAQIPEVQIPTSSVWVYSLTGGGGAWSAPRATRPGFQWTIAADGTIS